MQLTPRWYKLREHEGQHGLWTCKSRFVLVPCGRRSGKSEIAKRKLVLEAINPDSGYADANYFAAAPTHAQAQRIYWKDLKALIPKELITNIAESRMVIELYNGASIYVVGMDKPERLEGIPWNGGILDEYGNMKPKAWLENVRPALSDRNGWCWLIGVPEGRNHYYDLFLQAMDDRSGDWAIFQWPSSDILPESEIESAKRMLDELTYRQEYEADFVSFTGRAYYNFDMSLHTSHALTYNPNAPLIFCFDFNVSPGVAVVLQEQVLPGCFERVPNPRLFQGPNALNEALQCESPEAFTRRPIVGTGVIGEVHIAQNSTTPAVCRRLIQDWGKHRGEILCYGDASGGAGGSAKTEGSDWELIYQQLSRHYGDRINIIVPRFNPPERARVNAMNTRLKTADGVVSMLIDTKCQFLIKDLEGVRVLEGGSGEIDKKRDKKLTHMCFAGETPLNGQRIDSLPERGTGNTMFGKADFINPGIRGYSELVELVFADGQKVRCTPDHLIMTTKGWKPAVDCLDAFGYFVTQMEEARWSETEYGLMDSFTIGMADTIVAQKVRAYIKRFGENIMAQFQKAIVSITKMAIGATMPLKIWNACHLPIMQNCICQNPSGRIPVSEQSKSLLRLQEIGTGQTRGGNGIKGTMRSKREHCTKNDTRINAGIAEKSIRLPERSRAFAQKLVRQQQGEQAGLMECQPSVLNAGEHSCGTNISIGKYDAAKSAIMRIVEVRHLPGLHPVYCPKFEIGHFCLDNGLVVSNSDALGYYICYEFPVQADQELLEFPVANRF